MTGPRPSLENSKSMVFMNFVLKNGTYEYVCTECNASFKRKSNCTAHIRSVHLKKSKLCKYCMKSFKKLSQHIADVHGKTQFMCDVCAQPLDSLRCLKRHKMLKHEKEVSKVQKSRTYCEACGLSVPKEKLNHHIELKHLLPMDFCVPCPICKVSVKFLPFHINKSHNEYNIKRDLYSCKKCRRYFLNWTDLQTHNQSHDEYPCSMCSMVFEEFLQLGWHCFTQHRKVFNPGTKTRTKKQSSASSNLGQARLWDFRPGDDTSPGQDQLTIDDHEVSETDEMEIEILPDGKIFNINTGEEIPKDAEQLCQDVSIVTETLEDSFPCIESEGSDSSELICGNEEVDRTDFSSENIEMCKVDIPVLHKKPSVSQTFENQDYEALGGPSDPEASFFYIESLKEEVCIAVEEVELAETNVHADEGEKLPYYKLETSLTSEDAVAMDDKNLVEKLKNDVAEKKMRQIFNTKENLPRDLRDERLHIEDLKVLKSLSSNEGIEYKDLSRLQISAPPQDKSGRHQANRYKYVDSRQAHVCPYCRAILKSRFILQRHISVKHFNHRPHQCAICNKNFSSSADLKKHNESTHVPQVMVPCNVCGKEYRSGYISRHRQFAHKPSTPSSCDICDAIFKNREIMLQHRRKKHK